MQYKHQVIEQSTVWGSNRTKLKKKKIKIRKEEKKKKRFKAKLGDLNIFL